MMQCVLNATVSCENATVLRFIRINYFKMADYTGIIALESRWLNTSLAPKEKEQGSAGWRIVWLWPLFVQCIIINNIQVKTWNIYNMLYSYV